MFYYDPTVIFTIHEESLANFSSVQDLQGTYRVVDYSQGDGSTKATCYYEIFNVDYPDGTMCVYRREYLVVKMNALAAEWQRRHLIHLDAYKDFLKLRSNSEDGDGVATQLGEGTHEDKSGNTNKLDTAKAEAKRCSTFCPLYMDSSHLVKTKEEDAWEQAAVTAFNKYRVLVERFDELETDFQPITGYSSSTNTPFNSGAVPRALFDWPSVPGPTSPPVKRPEGFRGLYEDPGYALHEGCKFSEELSELVGKRAVARPTASSWTSSATRFITSFLPVVARSESQDPAFKLKQKDD